MATLTQEELLKLAHMSHVMVSEQEIPALLKQLHDVLDYAERVKDIVQGAPLSEQQRKNSNIMRSDVVIPTPTEPIMAQAPEQESNYFVVPMILEK